MNRLEDVREGMDVFDASGEKVGTVKTVKMGDPQAVTAEGQLIGERSSIIDALAEVFSGGDEMPDEQRARLLRLGYIEVDATGIGGNFAEAADALDRVGEDGVHLNTDRSS